MSDLFSVLVQKKNESVITLKVTIIHPDQTCFYWDTRFIIGLFEKPSCELDEKFKKKPVGLLGHYYSPYGDFNLIPENISDIFKRYTIGNIENYPFPKGTDYGVKWDSLCEEDKLPSAIYEVTFCDVKWIAHLNVGDVWTTTAFGTDPFPDEEIKENTFEF